MARAVPALTRGSHFGSEKLVDEDREVAAQPNDLIGGDVERAELSQHGAAPCAEQPLNGPTRAGNLS